MRITQFVNRVRELFSLHHADRDVTRETAAHVTLIEDDLRKQGLSAPEARRRARLAIGGLEQANERYREARSFGWLEDLRRDVPYATRALRRTPAFTIAALLTLGLGIGATTAVLSIVNTILFRPLPYKDADRLVRIFERVPSAQPGRPPARRSVDFTEFQVWRRQTRTLATMVASASHPQVMMTTPVGTMRVSAARVSPAYFDVLGIGARLGRTLQPADASAAVISSGTWRRFFNAEPAVLGSTITLRTDNAPLPFTVVGVMPEGFVDPAFDVDVWAPLVSASLSLIPNRLVGILGRLKPGVSVSAAADEADAIGLGLGPSIARGERPSDGSRRFELVSLHEEAVAEVRTPLQVLLAAAGLVLLIGCANVASLLLARATARQRELAVRLAVGASRARIVRQSLTECAVLSAAGGITGAALGAGGVALVKSLANIEAPGVFRLAFGHAILPRLQEVHIDAAILAVAFAVSAATVIVAGLVPALHAARTAQLPPLTARVQAGSGREGRMRRALVAGQLVLSTVLLVGAGLLLNSFIRLTRVDKGYDPTGVLAVQLALPAGYQPARTVQMIERVLARFRALPVVTGAGFSYAGVLVGVENTVGAFVPPGYAAGVVAGQADRPRLKSVSAGYLDAIGTGLVDGRRLRATDGPGAAPVVVVNRTVARRYFGGSSPVGSYFDWHSGDNPPLRVQIVGLVEDVRQGDPASEPYAEVFMDYRQVAAIQREWGSSNALINHLAFGFMSFAVRTSIDPRATIPSIRRILADTDPNAGIDAIAPLDELVAASVARPRFYTALVGAFAVVAAVLAAIGLYGLLSYAVQQRTRELGVRMALGATPAEILGLVLGRGGLLALAGVAAGLAGAAVATRSLSGMLFGITPLDPSTYAVVSLLFLLVALLASYLPARRATEVDPVVALRTE